MRLSLPAALILWILNFASAHATEVTPYCASYLANLHSPAAVTDAYSRTLDIAIDSFTHRSEAKSWLQSMLDKKTYFTCPASTSSLAHAEKGLNLLGTVRSGIPDESLRALIEEKLARLDVTAKTSVKVKQDTALVRGGVFKPRKYAVPNGGTTTTLSGLASDGKSFFTYTGETGLIQKINLSNGKVSAELKISEGSHDEQDHWSDLDEDGALVVSKVANRVTWLKRFKPSGNTFTPLHDWADFDSSRLELSTNHSRTMIVWDEERAYRIHVGDDGKVARNKLSNESTTVGLSPDGTHAFIQHKNEFFSVWNEKKHETGIHLEYDGIYKSMHVSKDNSLAAITTDETTLQIFDAKSGKRIRNIPLKGLAIDYRSPSFSRFSFSSDNKHLLVPFEDGGVGLVDVENGSIAEFELGRKAQTYPVDILAVADKAPVAVVLLDHKALIVIDMEHKEVLGHLSLSHECEKAVLSSDGKTLAIKLRGSHEIQIIEVPR